MINKFVLFGVGIILLLAFAIHRDIQIEKGGNTDLRNRVVGSRMQKDRVAPYFHNNWKQADGKRYYDPGNMNTSRLTNITATPFFHALLYPISELPQRQISYIWLIIEYLLFGITILLAYLSAAVNFQRMLVIGAAILFLYTEAWKHHISNGQLYIVMPFLAMVIYFFLRKSENLVCAFIAGTAAVMLVLIRPNAFLFFLPFLFIFRRYKPRYLLVFFMPVIMIAGYHFSNENNRIYWASYAQAIAASVKVHQHGLVTPPIAPSHFSHEYEGWNEKQIARDAAALNLVLYSENGNFFVLYYGLFHKPLPVPVLNILSVLCIITAMSLYYYSGIKYKYFELSNVALLGFCLYMISDLFSPIFRHQYNTVQWIFPLMIAMSLYKSSNKWIYLTILMGLLLNIGHIDHVKMEHTIGEYILLLAFLMLTLTGKLTSENDKSDYYRGGTSGVDSRL